MWFCTPTYRQVSAECFLQAGEDCLKAVWLVEGFLLEHLAHKPFSEGELLLRSRLTGQFWQKTILLVEQQPAMNMVHVFCPAYNKQLLTWFLALLNPCLLVCSVIHMAMSLTFLLSWHMASCLIILLVLSWGTAHFFSNTYSDSVPCNAWRAIL